MNNKQKTLIGIGATLVVVALFVGDVISVGSVAQYNDYMATSTAANSVYGAGITDDQLVKTGFGALGSVVVTGANTGVVNFYNATTSDITLRTNQTPTTTILIASMPASIAVGTYVFDATFTDGLLIELETGIMPTTTITYR